MIYFIIYIPFILSCFLDTKRVRKKTKNLICLFWVFILSLFWGLRWECGTDWDQFHDTYYLSQIHNIFTFDRGQNEPLEPGYVLINAIFNSFNLPYTIFLLALSFCTLYLWMKFCLKYTEYPIISFIYFIISLGIFFPTRQAVSMAILTLGYKYIINRSFFRFFTILLIATSIHTSALFGLCLYLLPIFKLNKKVIALLYITTFFIGNILPIVMNWLLGFLGGAGALIMVRLESYTQTVSSMGEDFSTRGTMSYLLSIFFILSFIWKRYNKSINILIRSSFNGYIAMEMIKSIFANLMRDLMRLELFFRPCAAIMMSHLFGNNDRNKSAFIISRSIFSCLMFYYFYKMLFGYFSDLYLPYKSIFL